MADLFVLVHSPLVGPFTWALVAEALNRRSIDTLVPVLQGTEGGTQPYWRQHVASVTRAHAGVPPDRMLVLVGHSGAGALLPAIGQDAARPVGAYIFADAGLPLDGTTRLDELEATAPEIARQLRAHLAAGGRFPEWTDEDLRDIVPDASVRRRLLAELHPQPLSFFEEPIPGFASGADARCAYFQFSEPYAAAAERARQLGWPHHEIAAGHFHMLVDPATVAAALVELAHAARQR